MNECEKKALLTERDYYKLMSLFLPEISKDKDTSFQVNYYYDTADGFLGSSNSTCRVRQKNADMFLTLKTPVGNELSETRREDTVPVECLPLNIMYKDKCLDLQGQVVTQRTKIHFSDDITVMLDKNIYLGICDYELEVEYKPEARHEAENLYNILIRSLGYTEWRKVASDSKYRRFRARQKQLISLDKSETVLTINI